MIDYSVLIIIIFLQKMNVVTIMKVPVALSVLLIALLVAVNGTFAMSGPGAGGAGFGNTSTVGGGNRTTNDEISDVRGIFRFILNTIDNIVVILLALGVAWIVYFALVLIKVEGEKKDEARNSIIYGLVGLFVMVSIWGLVNILINTFNVNSRTKQSAPTVYRPDYLPPNRTGSSI